MGAEARAAHRRAAMKLGTILFTIVLVACASGCTETQDEKDQLLLDKRLYRF